MSTNLQTLTAQLQTLQDTVKASVNVIETLQNEIKNLEAQAQVKAQVQDVDVTFCTFLSIELSRHFVPVVADEIVEKLKRCRKIGDYQYFTTAYRFANGDYHNRQLLKLVSAAYRLKFGNFPRSYQYCLKSEIKYAKMCPECGEFAAILYDRMKKENLI